MWWTCRFCGNDIELPELEPGQRVVVADCYYCGWFEEFDVEELMI